MVQIEGMARAEVLWQRACLSCPRDSEGASTSGEDEKAGVQDGSRAVMKARS